MSGEERGVREVRALDPSERALARRVFETALVALPPVALTTDEEPTGARYFDEGRQFGAFVDGKLVGTVDSYGGWLAVPGGRRLAHTAVTRVGVLPTHTRRGLLTALMRTQLDDAVARGDVVASLRASEATIYERFGYGIASQVARVEVTRSRAHWRPSAPAGSPVRLVEPAVSWDLLARIHEEAPFHQPGAIGRTAAWWNVRRRILEEIVTAPAYVAVSGEPGAEDGFARYYADTSTDWWRDDNRRIVVEDFVATTPRARAGLLRHLLGLDLVERIVFEELPFDDPLPAALTDHRAVRIVAAEDETWLRLLDVPAALAARTYGGTGRVVVDIVDDLLPANSGVYEISGSGAGRLAPSAAAQADLRTGVAELGAVYLGGTRWWQLAAAGRVEARTPAAVERADALFATSALPYAATGF